MDTDRETLQSATEYVPVIREPIGLTLDHIAYLLSDEYHDKKILDHETESTRQLYRKIAGDYVVHLTDEPIERIMLDHQLEREDEYRLKVRSLLAETAETNPVAQRVLASDLMVMYHLIVADGIDDLYTRCVQELAQQKLSIPSREEDVLAAKINLAMNIVSEQRELRKELFHAENSPISIGVELEHDDPLYHLIMRYTANFVPDEDQEEFEELRNQFSMWRDYKPWILRKAARNNMPVTSVLAETGAFTHITDYGNVKEIVVTPAASPLTLVKDVETLSENNGIEGSWRFHQTIVGIKLDRSNTQSMDITLLSTSAGILNWYEDNAVHPAVLNTLNMGKPTLTETECKAFLDPDDDVFIYYPFHLPRYPDKIKSYVQQETNGMERRSIPAFYKESFDDFSTDLMFAYSAALGIRAEQTPPQERTSKEDLYLEAWNTLISSWRDLLDRRELHYPTNNERYIVLEDNEYWSHRDSDKVRGNTGYELALSQIAVHAAQSEDFRVQSLSLITAYMDRVNAILYR